MASVTHAFLLAAHYFHTLLAFLKQRGNLLFPVTNAGSLIVLWASQVDRTIIAYLEFLAPLHGSSLKLSVLLEEQPCLSHHQYKYSWVHNTQ